MYVLGCVKTHSALNTTLSLAVKLNPFNLLLPSASGERRSSRDLYACAKPQIRLLKKKSVTVYKCNTLSA